MPLSTMWGSRSIEHLHVHRMGGARLIRHWQQATSHVEKLPFIKSPINAWLILCNFGIETLQPGTQILVFGWAARWWLPLHIFWK
jgi:hypothetical protein